jgi:hypothetical protein
MRETVKELFTRGPSEQEVTNWLDSATVEEREDFIVNGWKYQYVGDRGRDYLRRAQLTLERKIVKHHWSVTPGFWVAFAAMVFAAIAAWPVIREWLPGSAPSNKGSGFQPPQSQAGPASPATNKTSQPVSVP